ncbi:MAG: tRNA (guanosine(37)-N1)-methyltransferase TrmD [Chitinophagia bacterium]|nr:tRNA (guanosine(37)-N1)-methyltransferase TrmD [Chitinophagia bacterium]
MVIDIVTVLPELLESPFAHSILKRAREKGLMEVNLYPLRKWAVNAYGQVDDYAFGGGAGMVMMCEPLVRAIEELSAANPYDEVIYFTPDGNRFNQRTANRLSLKGRLLMICGHYKGIDQRVRDGWVTMEISIGDYVLSGGELAAAVVADAVGRLLPGVLNDDCVRILKEFFAEARRRRAEGQEHKKGAAKEAADDGLVFDGP